MTRDSLQRYLEGYPERLLVIEGVSSSCGEIMDVLIYGGLAHTNPRLKQIYNIWKLNPLAFSLLQIEFYGLLTYILSCIDYVVYLSEQELKA